jgi:hypothetical protein
MLNGQWWDGRGACIVCQLTHGPVCGQCTGEHCIRGFGRRCSGASFVCMGGCLRCLIVPSDVGRPNPATVGGGMAMFGAQTDYVRWFQSSFSNPIQPVGPFKSWWHPAAHTIFESGSSTTNPTLSRQSAMSRFNHARNPSGGGPHAMHPYLSSDEWNTSLPIHHIHRIATRP